MHLLGMQSSTSRKKFSHFKVIHFSDGAAHLHSFIPISEIELLIKKLFSDNNGNKFAIRSSNLLNLLTYFVPKTHFANSLCYIQTCAFSLVT